MYHILTQRSHVLSTHDCRLLSRCEIGAVLVASMADSPFDGLVSPALGQTKLFAPLLQAVDPVLPSDACRRPRAPRALDAVLMKHQRCANAYPSCRERRRCRVTQRPRHHRHVGLLLTTYDYTAPAAIGTAFPLTLGQFGPLVSNGSCLAHVGEYLVECQVGKTYLYHVSRASIIPFFKGPTSLDTQERHKSRTQHIHRLPALWSPLRQRPLGTHWTSAETLLRCRPGPGCV